MSAHRTSRIHRSLAVVCLMGTLASCTGWRNVPVTEPLPAFNQGGSLKVTLRNGNEFELRKVHLIGDSLIGEAGQWSMPVRRAIAARDIQKLADRHFSAGNTAGALAGVVGVAAILSLVVSAEVGSSLRCPFGCP
jgi:hypothetical protein